MAGDWIKMRANLFRHPKVVRISSALQADTFRTVGALMSVWCLFDEHTTDGNLVGYTVHTLDDHLRWPGFAAAMRAVSWLEETAEGLVLPEFSTHNGASAKRRAQDSDRKRTDRKMSAPDADKKRTREEKRREENIPSLVPGEAGRPDCPHEAILALYHEHLPVLPAVKVWSEKRKKLLQSRWREDEKRQDLDFWRRFFKYVAASDFLTGRAGSWQADLEWLLNSSNFVKVIEGKYENRETK